MGGWRAAIMAGDTPHSAEQFGKQRDYWWNPDFLSLLRSRWNLTGKKSVADIGCGLGHWSALLLGFLDPGSRLVGVDRETEWVTRAEASVRSRLAHPDNYLFDFRQGDAERLPLGDNEFDVVTCQTVLMHLADPKRAVAEMVRVARPGGLILCIEPDNFLNYFAYNSLTEDRALDDLVQEYRFWLCVHRGRIKAGHGNDSIGRLLPGFFSELGLEDVQVVLSDKATPFVPPYSTPPEKAWLAQVEEWHNQSAGPYDYELLCKYASSVIPDTEWVSQRLAALDTSFTRFVEAVDRGQYHAADAGLSFIVWGRKP
jgi:SAM-dependent methyltransferase